MGFYGPLGTSHDRGRLLHAHLLPGPEQEDLLLSRGKGPERRFKPPEGFSRTCLFRRAAGVRVRNGIEGIYCRIGIAPVSGPRPDPPQPAEPPPPEVIPDTILEYPEKDGPPFFLGFPAVAAHQAKHGVLDDIQGVFPAAGGDPGHAERPSLNGRKKPFHPLVGIPHARFRARGPVSRGGRKAGPTDGSLAS